MTIHLELCGLHLPHARYVWFAGCMAEVDVVCSTVECVFLLFVKKELASCMHGHPRHTVCLTLLSSASFFVRACAVHCHVWSLFRAVKEAVGTCTACCGFGCDINPLCFTPITRYMHHLMDTPRRMVCTSLVKLCSLWLKLYIMKMIVMCRGSTPDLCALLFARQHVALGTLYLRY